MSKLFPTILIIILALSAEGLQVASSQTGPMLWEPDRRLTRTQGESRTSINFARSIAADEAGRVHIVWREQATDGPVVQYKRSPDGGVSWGPAIRLGLAPGPLGSGNPSDPGNPGISTSGATVHVVWWDARAAPQAPPQIRYTQSLDGGLTWEADRAITNSPGGGFYPSLAVWGNARHVVYVDGRDGNAEVYYTRSLDAGATWSAPVRLSALPNNSYTPTVAVWQSNVYVAWTDTRHGGSQLSLEEEYFRRSTDGGANFEPEQRLTTDPPGSPANSWAPSLAARDQYVWISWFDNRDGNFEIYTKRSLDGGVSWSSDTRLTTTAAESQRPSIALRGQQIFISYWEADRLADTDGGNEEIFVLRSDDLGLTWGPPDRLTFASGSSKLPSLAAAASGVHVTWTDTRDGNAEAYYKRLPGKAVRVGNGRIAFTRFINGPPNGIPQIFTVAPDGTDERQLTFAGRNEYPAWSKDGTKLAFSSNRSGGFEIWTMNPDGSDQRQITHSGPVGSFVPDWSYDGTRIAYAFLDQGVGHPEVWVMNADGSQQTRLTNTPPSGGQFTWSLHPTWEPGDTRIYYASTASGVSQVWGMFSNGLGKEQKTFGLGPDTPHANAPKFGRDGRLAFWAGVEGQYGEVWTWDMPGSGSPRRLTTTPDPQNSDNPSWSPDGTKLLFDSNRPSPSGGVNIWSIALDGSNQRLLIPGGIGQTSWQPVFNANANTNVSAASYVSTSLAPESIVSAFGSGLATATLAAASTPLPTTLAGSTVKVRDSAGVERFAPLFFVSPAQVNYQMPPGTANGAATITVTSGDGSVSTGVSQITSVAPGVFAANASGQGVAAAIALRIKADGSQSYEPVAQFDPAQNKFVAVPIDLGPETDQVFLLLFGTGIRSRSSLSAVIARIGGADAQVTFAGAQEGFVGLDQVNARLSRSLIGRGEVDVVLAVDGQAANTARVSIR